MLHRVGTAPQWCRAYLTTQEDPLGVEVKGEVPVLLCGVLCSTVLIDTGIVDCNVQPAQFSNNSLDHPASPICECQPQSSNVQLNISLCHRLQKRMQARCSLVYTIATIRSAIDTAKGNWLEAMHKSCNRGMECSLLAVSLLGDICADRNAPDALATQLLCHLLRLL